MSEKGEHVFIAMLTVSLVSLVGFCLVSLPIRSGDLTHLPS